MNTYAQKLSPRLPFRTIGISGFSLVEMMISITIGLMIIAALVAVLVSNSGSAKTNDRTSELQSNGRYALDHLKRELRHVGYRGFTSAEPSAPTTAIAIPAPGSAGGECAAGFVLNFRQGIWGANDSNPYSGPGGCLPAANRVRGDVLVIRRVANQATAALTAGTLYLRSTYAIGEVFQAGAAPVVPGSPIADFALQEYVYYIGKDDTDANLPALRRIALRADRSMVDEMVVSGIEHMQVQYGRATADLNTRYSNANGITGTSTDAGQTDWDQVNSVRIWLLVRSSKAETGYVNTSTYAMGDIATYPPASDSFRRQLFTAVVQLRNDLGN